MQRRRSLRREGRRFQTCRTQWPLARNRRSRCFSCSIHFAQTHSSLSVYAVCARKLRDALRCCRAALLCSTRVFVFRLQSSRPKRSDNQRPKVFVAFLVCLFRCLVNLAALSCVLHCFSALGFFRGLKRSSLTRRRFAALRAARWRLLVHDGGRLAHVFGFNACADV